MNFVAITGTVDRLSERQGQNGNFYTFTVIEKSVFTPRGGQPQERKSYHDCICFDTSKLHGVQDGALVLVSGYLSYRKVTNGDGSDVMRTWQGQNGGGSSAVYSAQIKVDSVETTSAAAADDFPF